MRLKQTFPFEETLCCGNPLLWKPGRGLSLPGFRRLSRETRHVMARGEPVADTAAADQNLRTDGAFVFLPGVFPYSDRWNTSHNTQQVGRIPRAVIMSRPLSNT
jgi:hypothetical protein